MPDVFFSGYWGPVDILAIKKDVAADGDVGMMLLQDV